MQILHKITLTLLVFILLFTGYFHYITALSQDLGRHLKTGELILATKSVPAVNLFSYTYPQFPFINHHWLSEVIFFIVHQMGGFPLLFILMLVLILVGFGIVFHYASRRFSFPAVIIASSLYLPILFERTDLRPELFSFFFLTLTLVILFTYRERFTRTLYLLPVILFLWVNLHIYFFIGILTLFIFLFDELVRERKKLTNNHTKVLLIVTLASCIAIFFNPHGLQGALYPLRVFDNYGYTIEENQTFYLLESLGFHKPSVLFYGPPGLGKTTLSHIIAREMGSNIRVTSGPAIERAGDLASILTNLEKGDILFIDEIHRLNKVVEETLYPAMEDYALDIVIGKGPSARAIRLDLPQFTIVGATTRVGLLSGPLRDRFGVVHRLNFYKPSELSEIIDKASSKLQVPIDTESMDEVARRSRGTPRIALKLLKRVRDFAQVKGEGKITGTLTREALEMLEVDSLGLDSADIRFIKAIIEKHSGGPVGVETIASTISEDTGTLEEVIEPYLMQLGFLKRTPRGRVATKAAYEHFGIAYAVKDDSQQKLL